MESSVKVFEFTLNHAGQPDLCTEPLVIRSNAGDCVKLRLTTASETTGHTSSYEYSFDAAEPGIFCFRDCFGIPDLSGALVIEEPGATFHDIYTGRELAFGTQAVIRRRDNTAFREFVLFAHDSDINRRSEPLQNRLEKNSAAYCFSSVIHGDPSTPVLETYPGDELKILTVDEDSGRKRPFCIAGLPGNPEHTQSVRINYPYAAGDYLYYFGGENERRKGLWGILRAYGETDNDLIPLHEQPKSSPLPACPDCSDVLPENAPVRKYAAAVVHSDRRCGKNGKKCDSDVSLVPFDIKKKKAKKRSRSLTISANAGEWIEFTLYNMLAPASGRLSLCPRNLFFDPVRHSGANIGRNQWEQTVQPGKSRTYLWYADRDIAFCELVSLGDIRISSM